MTTADRLRAARALIATLERWTTRTPFRLNEQGQLAYCMAGAMHATSDSVRPRGDNWTYLQLALLERHRTTAIEAWNDAPGRTHAEVLAAFDRAIELAKEAGQ